MFNIPISIKAATAAVTAFVFNVIGSDLHVGLSNGVKELIASALALGIAFAIPEGAAYINKWLKDRNIPADIDVTSVRKP